MLIEGVVKEFPVPKLVPPLAEAYHSRDPALAVALSTTVPASHLAAGVVEVTVGVAFTVASTAVRVEVHELPTVAST